LAPGQYGDDSLQRSHFAPIRQAHIGTHDLVFGCFYRPDTAGWNDTHDVGRLARYLDGIDPRRWPAADLARLPEFDDGTGRAEELEFAREVFVALRELYRGARDAGQVVICEEL